MRRYWLTVAISLITLAFVSSPSEAQRRSYCPAGAESASYDVWPPLSLSGGQTVIGRHPCGGHLRCWAATFVRDRGEIRRCTWLR